MNFAKACEFDIDIFAPEINDGKAGMYIWGPLWCNMLLPTAEEAKLIADRTLRCCFQPHHFGMCMSNGDNFSISHWRGAVLLQYHGARTFLEPKQANLLASVIGATRARLAPLIRLL
jgi:hypothetical protein